MSYCVSFERHDDKSSVVLCPTAEDQDTRFKHVLHVSSFWQLFPLAFGDSPIMRSCALSLELDPAFVESNATLVSGDSIINSLRDLDAGKVHKLTLVLP